MAPMLITMGWCQERDSGGAGLRSLRTECSSPPKNHLDDYVPANAIKNFSTTSWRQTETGRCRCILAIEVIKRIATEPAGLFLWWLSFRSKPVRGEALEWGSGAVDRWPDFPQRRCIGELTASAASTGRLRWPACTSGCLLGHIDRRFSGNIVNVRTIQLKTRSFCLSLS